jgi:predicted signal transduction protein with EAL and GGDEF domain
MLEGKKIWNAGSVGIAIYPEHARDVDTLLRAADVALYHAKKERRGSYQIFEASLTEATRRRDTIDRRLRGAIASNALAVHYQPKYEMRGRKLQGAEALLRWHDAELGTVGPREFIPVAEECGLIRQLGDWVIETVCADMERWIADRRAIVPISVNVSSRQFAEADMTRVIADALDRHGVDPRSIEIELTESSILQNDERTAACLREIRAIGVRVSLDDFGTG